MMARNTDDSGEGAAPRRTRLPAAERREVILRAAAGVFAEAGYRAAKVSDIAARVGVTEPVVFQNFGSKSALFAAVVQRAAAEVRESLDELASGPGPASRLLVHVLAGPEGREPGHAAPPWHPGPGGGGLGGTAYGVLFADAAALAAEPGLAGPARDAVRAVAAHLADLVRHAQARGGVRPDADADAAGWLLLSVLAARRLRAVVMPPGLEPAVTALALAGIVPGILDEGTGRSAAGTAGGR